MDPSGIRYETRCACEARLSLLVGGANVFDQEPPQLTRTGAGNEYLPIGNALLTSNYDMLGRRFFVNATWNFE